ncbi:hypothetical protein RUND412_001839 [Rhizina undulata]
MSLNIENEEPPALISADATVQELEEEAFRAKRVPITIVTGYLGAGKTTLMNYILTEQHSKRIAIILNGLSPSVDIEKSLTIQTDGQQVEEWLELANGCICCSVKDAGVAAIENLMERRGKFDYILLETTGLADPGNIAPLFWTDEGLGSSICLDGIVTLVDAANIFRSLDDRTPSEGESRREGEGELTTAHLQISHADVVVVNKKDLVPAEELEKVLERIRGINAVAKIVVTERGKVENLEGWLLDLGAYAEVGSLKTDGKSLLDPSISTVAMTVPRLSGKQLDLFDAWIRSLLWEGEVPTKEKHIQTEGKKRPEVDIHRMKGRLETQDGKILMLQGVREVFEIFDAPNNEPVSDGGSGEGKIVLIGRGLENDVLQKSLEWFLTNRAG